jgi:RNA polymerase sigma factor (sigma-70 family)
MFCSFVRVRPDAAGLVSPSALKSETIWRKGGLTGLQEFADLIESHQALVFRTLARLTGEREGLEDMAQEVFLRLFRAWPHFRGKAKVSTFLYRIIVNVVNDEWHRRQVARRGVSIDDEEFSLVHPAPGPEELLQRAQFQEAVESLLKHLAVRDRTILTLHYQEDRSYEEIATILELPMGTVKTHLHRAREQLKAAMGEWISQCKIKC